ncbi:unnamed protein product, partial [Ascophyllum nodosum]
VYPPRSFRGLLLWSGCFSPVVGQDPRSKSCSTSSEARNPTISTQVSARELRHTGVNECPAALRLINCAALTQSVRVRLEPAGKKARAGISAISDGATRGAYQIVRLKNQPLLHSLFWRGLRKEQLAQTTSARSMVSLRRTAAAS